VRGCGHRGSSLLVALIALVPRATAITVGIRSSTLVRAANALGPYGRDGPGAGRATQTSRPAGYGERAHQGMDQQRSNRRTPRDRGTAAVEFALVLPVLLFILFGIIDFGRALNAQIVLTQAAREGARLAAVGQPNVVSRTQAAATGLSPVNVTVTPCPVGSGPSANAAVSVSYQFQFVTPVGALSGLFGGGGLGAPLTLTAQGVMPCET
jgi:hypothetical protein